MSKRETVHINNNHGFKANLRQTTSSIIYPIEWLRKMGVFFAITIKRAIVSMVTVVLLLMVGALILMTSPLRLQFLWLPMLILLISALIFLAQYAFINPSYGSFFSIGKSLASQLKERKLVAKGKIPRSRETDAIYVDENAVIHHSNGDVGRLVQVDGSTTLFAFPSEVLAQESRGIRYHTTRERTTTEVEITSSQKQSAEKQIKNLQHLERSNVHPAVISVCKQEEKLLSKTVDGKKSTVIQYKLIRDKTERGLQLALDHLYRFEVENYYYSVVELSKSETEEILKDINFLK